MRLRLCQWITYILCLMLFSSSLFAAAGFYVSPSISYDSIKAKHTDVRYIGYTPRLALGYGTDFLCYKWFFLAGELFLSYGSITHDDNTKGIGSLKPRASFGASILPSVIFDPTLTGYLRLGAISTRFQSFNTNKLGYQLGIGFEGALCPPWTVRIEYVRTAYHSISEIGKPKMDEFTLGLVYRFL